MAELSPTIPQINSNSNQDIKMTCQTVIVYGSTPVAWELLLKLHQRNLQPLFLSTNEILSLYWCSGGQVEELNQLRMKVDEAKITKVLDNRLESVEHRDKDQLFYVKTNQGEFVSMCLVLCSESAIKEYRPHVDKYRGLFTCGVSKKIADTIEDIEFHLQLTTESLRSSLIEPPPQETTLEKEKEKLEPQAQPPPRKLLCCC